VRLTYPTRPGQERIAVRQDVAMTEPPPEPPPEPPDEPHRGKPLLDAIAEVDRHLALGGWDQPTRLYALVRTADLLASEPALAQTLGLQASASAHALTPVEQDSLPTGTPLDEWLAEIGWPAEVAGCALSQEVLTLPPSVEADLPADADAVAWAVTHPLRREVRMVVGVLRDGSRTATLRVRGVANQPDDVVSGTDLVPLLTDALAATLVD
jgi:hypothetical protein